MSGHRDCTCQSCSVTFRAARADAKYCSAKCRQRSRRKPEGFRSGLLAKALKASGFLVGRMAPSYSVGKRAPVFGLMLPRSAVLAELNGFLAMPEPFTDAELSAVLRSEGILDYQAALPEEAKGMYAKRSGHA